MKDYTRAAVGTFLTLALAACAVEAPEAPPEAPASDGSTEQVIARALAFELDTEYVPPPGEAMHHETAGFAQILCAGVFITGLDPADAAANVGGFISDFDLRGNVVDTVVDFATQSVALTLPDGVTRTAKRYKNQGCVTHGIGEDSVHFVPSEVQRNLPPAATTPWPMGDVLSTDPWPAEVDMDLVEQALDVGFGSEEARTLGLVVTYKGRILGERYDPGVDIHTPLESWSMTKSLTGTLVGILIEQGVYGLWDPAPFPEWQSAGDPRQEIRIGDIMRMSSGLRINAPGDPDRDESTYFDHLYLYTATDNSYEYAATRPQQWPANTIGRYRNTDPVLGSYLVRLGVEGRGEDYHSFPQRHLFDKIGIRDGLIQTDPQGNFLGQGLAFMPARDWARLGNLYLQDGIANGERLLPEGFVEYASTVAPAWESDGRLVYGGAFFWVNGNGAGGLPTTMYSMRGAGGQSTIIFPSRDLVVVRLGKYTGAGAGGEALSTALTMLMEAIPPVGT